MIGKFQWSQARFVVNDTNLNEARLRIPFRFTIIDIPDLHTSELHVRMYTSIYRQLKKMNLPLVDADGYKFISTLKNYEVHWGYYTDFYQWIPDRTIYKFYQQKFQPLHL